MSRLVDLTGKRFGMLTVVGEGDRNSFKSRMRWLCRCDCGVIKVVDGSSLKQGKTKSCGCFKATLLATYSTEKNTTHGLSKHRLYDTFKTMHSRCYNPENNSYEYYGGRGIIVEDEWHNIHTFIEDMYQSFIEGYSLERLDNNSNYGKENCMWLPVPDQARHHRMKKNNKSGVTGVYHDQNKNYVCATWRDNGKQYMKCFSLSKYTYDEAFKLACEYREGMIEKLVDKGVAYHPEHGK